jgi:hypothetical protein
MKIANIVSKNKINVNEEFNLVESMDEIIHGLPTLIIGFDYVNKHYPDFDILNSELEPNVYWTFKKTERRDKHEEDLIWFENKVYSDLAKTIKYVFVDPIQYNKKSLIKIIRKIYSLDKAITFINDKMIYIYGDNLIFGIDLKLLHFVGLDINKIKYKIKTKSIVFLGESEILIEYKNYIDELGLQVKFLPFLYFIRNEQNNTISNFYFSRES